MHSTSNFLLWLKFSFRLEVTLVRPWYAMKEFIANCCLFLEFLNWNVLWKWSKFSDNFCSPTNKSNLFTRMKGFLYYPSKASTKLFLPFLTENHGGKSTYCLLSKQSHINSLSLWKGVVGYWKAIHAARGHFIGPFHHQSHEQKPIWQPSFLHFWHLWKKLARSLY